MYVPLHAGAWLCFVPLRSDGSSHDNDEEEEDDDDDDGRHGPRLTFMVPFKLYLIVVT